MRNWILVCIFALIFPTNVIANDTNDTKEQVITVEQLRDQMLERQRKHNRIKHQRFVVECRGKGGIAVVSDMDPGYAICFDRSMFGD